MSAMTQEVIVEPGTNPIVVDGSATDISLTNTQLRATPVPVSGTVTATGPLTDTQLRATPVPISGTVTTSPVVSSSSTVVQITSNSSNQTLLAANANRKKVILHFASGIWSVKFGATASATSRTLQVSSAGFYLEETIWKGIIDAVCTTSGKLVDVTELV